MMKSEWSNDFIFWPSENKVNKHNKQVENNEKMNKDLSFY